MRQFRDQDGVEWKAEAVPAEAMIEPGQAVPIMDEVAWRVRFYAQDPPASRLLIVSSDLGLRFEDVTDEELRELLRQAAGE